MIAIEENDLDTKFVARRKTAVLKKYKPTNSRSLEEANELAVYIYSLNREDETEKLLESYCEESPFVNPRFERWEAACFAMLFNADLKKKKGNIEEYERLMAIIINDYFNPFNWFKEGDLDEFIASVSRGLEGLDDCTKHEKCQDAAQGYLAILYAIHVWSREWQGISSRVGDLNKLMDEQLNRVNQLVQ